MRDGIAARIDTGTYVSGIGHAGLFLWVLLGGFFVSHSDLPEISVTDVSIISADDFEALQPQSPETGDAPPAPAITENTDTVPAPAPAVSDSQPAPRPEVPQTLPETVNDVVPDVPDETAEPVVEPQPDVAVLGDTGGTEIGPDEGAVPENAPVITDEVVEAPQDDVQTDEAATEETAPSPEASVVEEVDDTTAPEQSTTEIVTEADEPQTSAPTISKRPGRKPTPPAPQVTEATSPGLQDLINETVSEVTANSENAIADNANAGGGTSSPISQQEKGAFIIGIQKCWNVGALGTDALRVSVVVAFSMDRDGRPQGNSIRMIASEGGTGDAVTRAYETARRAIIRCGVQGYDLPADKYDQWQEVEVTFNASRKQIR